MIPRCGIRTRAWPSRSETASPYNGKGESVLDTLILTHKNAFVCIGWWRLFYLYPVGAIHESPVCGLCVFFSGRSMNAPTEKEIIYRSHVNFCARKYLCFLGTSGASLTEKGNLIYPKEIPLPIYDRTGGCDFLILLIAISALIPKARQRRASRKSR